MKVHLSGHLSWYHPQKSAWFEMQPTPHTRPVDLLEQLGVPLAEVAVILVNGKPVDTAGQFLNDGDTVEVFPPVSGG